MRNCKASNRRLPSPLFLCAVGATRGNGIETGFGQVIGVVPSAIDKLTAQVGVRRTSATATAGSIALVGTGLSGAIGTFS